MGLLDSAMGAAGGLDIGALASKVGLSEEQAKMVLQALAKFTAEPGETADQASAATGVEKSKVEQLLAQVGGEGALAKIAPMLKGAGGIGGMLGKI